MVHLTLKKFEQFQVYLQNVINCQFQRLTLDGLFWGAFCTARSGENSTSVFTNFQCLFHFSVGSICQNLRIQDFATSSIGVFTENSTFGKVQKIVPYSFSLFSRKFDFLDTIGVFSFPNFQRFFSLTEKSDFSFQTDCFRTLI